MAKKIAYEVGSGNVYEDLGLPHADSLLTKSELAVCICEIIREEDLTQEEAAKKLGVSQPKISALVNGQLQGFSIERLIRFLNALGRDVTITVGRKSKKKAGTRVAVA